MSYPFSLPQNYKIIAATPNGAQSDTALITLDSISLKYAHKVWMVFVFQQVAANATVITPMVGATVATANVAITFAARWWLNVDISLTDTLVEQAAAVTATTTGGVTTDQMIVIEIDPSDVLAQLGTYDCLGGTIAASGVANFVAGFYIVAPRYQQATPPSMIVD